MFASDRDAFIAHLSLTGQQAASQQDKVRVSRETYGVSIDQPKVLAKLDRYKELLEEWNERINLVSASTLPHVWTRHFLDSAQLTKFIPITAKSVADLGSGAGFPGLVLSILGAPEVHLIESTGKKVNFLRTVIDELKLNATVRQERIEDITDLKVDVVTARALGSLRDLLKLSRKFLVKDGLCLFLKGKNAAEELTESQKYWTFALEKMPSLSDPSGTVLSISDVRPRDPKAGMRKRYGN